MMGSGTGGLRGGGRDGRVVCGDGDGGEHAH